MSNYSRTRNMRGTVEFQRKEKKKGRNIDGEINLFQKLRMKNEFWNDLEFAMIIISYLDKILNE